MKKRKNKLKYIAIIVIILSFLLDIYLLWDPLLVGISKLTIDLTVGDHFGFNADTDAIHLGTVKPTWTGIRNITIENYNCKVCKVSIRVKGQLENIVKISDNGFILKKGESKQIQFSATVPKDMPYGKYNSTVYIIFHRKVI